jgi:hypothetical protein
MIEGRAMHQVQSALVRAGLSFQGARQIVSGLPLSNPQDCKVLASLMIALAENSGTILETFNRVGAKLTIGGYGTNL